MRTPVLALVIVASLLSACPALAQPVIAALDYGPHPVGFRAVSEADRSRTVQSKTAFDGAANPGDPAMPMQIGIWYPAADPSSGSPMTAERYKTLWTAMERDALVADYGGMVSGVGLTATSEQVLEALTRSTRARRDAAASKGSFPLIVAGAPTGMTWPAFEYFASHGYVVVASWSSMRTATLQATQPAIALETQTRNLEYLAAFAQRQGLGDATKLGVVGVNFDGMAALNFEMRNMRADAVISMDGYEGKRSGTTMLRASPYFEPLRMRVPYLIFVQDERDPGPQLIHDRAVFDALAYSPRYWFVLDGFNHGRLISDAANVATLTADQRAGHAFIIKTMRRFLDAYVKRDAATRAAFETSPSDGLPAGVQKTAFSAAGLRPAPTPEEFERLVMDGPIERAVRAYRDARADNPRVQVFDESTINLYAFRYAQRKQFDTVLELRRLAVEAFPGSADAAFRLGVSASDAGQSAESRAAFDRALELLESSSMPADRKEAMRKEIAGRSGLKTRAPH
jgi:dienelactone hydrolase